MEVKKKKSLDTLKTLPMLEKDKKEFVKILCEDNVVVTPPTDSPADPEVKLRYYKIDINKATELGYYTDGQITNGSVFALVFDRGILPGAKSINVVEDTFGYINMPASLSQSMGVYVQCTHISFFESQTMITVDNGVKTQQDITIDYIFNTLTENGLDKSIFIEITKEEFMNPI